MQRVFCLTFLSLAQMKSIAQPGHRAVIYSQRKVGKQREVLHITNHITMLMTT